MGRSEHFLVTGALGCLGSWVVKRLVDDAIGVSTLDLSPSDHRLRLTCDAADLDEIDRREGDVADIDGLLELVDDIGITHIVHLAGLQVPFVRADPVAGAHVNVVGTAAVLDVARRRPDQIQGLVFASSGGVFGRADQYPQEVLGDDAPHYPPTIYGVYKHANEQMAGLYWSEYQVPSIGLRPFIVYGPGRDQGMTSAPTKAMLAAAAGRPLALERLPLAERDRRVDHRPRPRGRRAGRAGTPARPPRPGSRGPGCCASSRPTRRRPCRRRPRPRRRRRST